MSNIRGFRDRDSVTDSLPAEPAFPCSDDNNSQPTANNNKRIWIVEHPARRPPPGRWIRDVELPGRRPSRGPGRLIWDVEHLGPQRLSGPGFVCVIVVVCVYIGIQLFSAKMKLAGAPPGSEVWGGVGASTGMGYIGIQLFSAKMMLAGAPPGWAFWGGVRVGERGRGWFI